MFSVFFFNIFDTKRHPVETDEVASRRCEDVLAPIKRDQGDNIYRKTTGRKR
jgi:hypothetical protein